MVIVADLETPAAQCINTFESSFLNVFSINSNTGLNFEYIFRESLGLSSLIIEIKK